MEASLKKVIFTCGGTAGHVNPAIALAQLMREKDPETEFLFVGAERGLEKDLIPKAGYDFRTVHISSFHRSFKPREIRHNLVSVGNLLRAPGEARAILRQFRPDVVIGTGGYASFPMVKAAAKAGIPTAVHESNMVPGLTTENLMLAACGAEGVTVISNAAREPEVVDLQNFLNACGARVSGAGSSAVSIEGGQDLHGCTYRVMPDRIAAATYLCAAASAGGDIYLRGAEEGHLSTVTAALREAGCTVTADSGGIRALCWERLRAVGPVQTAPYPGFPTDAQAVLMAALLRSRGATVFEENIFENRYRHVDELIRMGASIRVSGRVAVVTGVERLHSAPVRCTDLRGGAALCVAALAAEGETRVSQICHIDRGYEDLARDLRALGADAVRVEETENG